MGEILSQAEVKERGWGTLVSLGYSLYPSCAREGHIFIIILSLHIFQFSFSGKADEMRTFYLPLNQPACQVSLKMAMLLSH